MTWGVDYQSRTWLIFNEYSIDFFARGRLFVLRHARTFNLCF